MSKWIPFVLLHFISQARVILQHHGSDATLLTPITAASAGHLSGGTRPTGHRAAAGRLNPSLADIEADGACYIHLSLFLLTGSIFHNFRRMTRACSSSILPLPLKELNSLSKVLVVDELIPHQTLARPAALSPADSSGGEFLHRTVPTGWGPATGRVHHPFGNLAVDGTLERLSGGEIVPPLEHPLS